MEAALPGLLVGGGADDLQKGIVGPVLIARRVLRAVPPPEVQEALGVQGVAPEVHESDVIVPGLQGLPQLVVAEGHQLQPDPQALHPGLPEGVRHGGVLLRILIDEAGHGGAGVAALLQQGAGLRQGLLRAALSQKVAPLGPEVLAVLIRHAVGHEAVRRAAHQRCQVREGLPVDGERERLPGLDVREDLALGVEEQHRGLQLSHSGPVALGLGLGLRPGQGGDEVRLSGVIGLPGGLRAVVEEEAQLLRSADGTHVGRALRQDQLPRLAVACGVGAVGHESRGVGGPVLRPGLPPLLRLEVFLDGLLLQGLEVVLPQGHGGGVGADILQKPAALAEKSHNEGELTLRRDLQFGHIPGGADLVIARHGGEQGRAGGIGHRVRQALPGVDEVPRRHRLPVGPLGLPQVEGVGHRPVVVLLHVVLLRNAGGQGGPAGGVRRLPEEVFIEVDDHRLRLRRLRPDGVVAPGLLPHAEPQGKARGAPAAAARQRPRRQGEAEAHRRHPFPHLHRPRSYISRSGAPVPAERSGTVK